MRLLSLAVAAAATILAAHAATAADPVSRSVIKTGGSKGAYHGAFCPRSSRC